MCKSFELNVDEIYTWCTAYGVKHTRLALIQVLFIGQVVLSAVGETDFDKLRMPAHLRL